MSAEKDFVNWLAKRNPGLLKKAIYKIKSKGAIEPFGFAQGEETEEETAWYTQITDVVGNLATEYVKFKQQREIIKMNAERAKQGLPPLDPGDVAPQANVEVSVGWETLKWPVLIGGGLVTLMFLRGK